jgi:hypothetical protein
LRRYITAQGGGLSLPARFALHGAMLVVVAVVLGVARGVLGRGLHSFTLELILSNSRTHS